MENTIENKARFFAQYWGQAIMNYNGKICYPSEFIRTKAIKDSFLELTPLSQISDEDARFVIDIYNKMCNKPIHQSQTKVGVFGEVFKQIFWIYPTSCPNDDGYRVAANFSDDTVNVIDSPNRFEVHIQCIDYLRSRGYALPWMGLSVAKLVEYGWVKLKGVG